MNSTMIIYFQEKLLLKCDETHLESDAIKRVHKALNERSKLCGCPPYRYFIID